MVPRALLNECMNKNDSNNLKQTSLKTKCLQSQKFTDCLILIEAYTFQLQTGMLDLIIVLRNMLLCNIRGCVGDSIAVIKIFVFESLTKSHCFEVALIRSLKRFD